LLVSTRDILCVDTFIRGGGKQAIFMALKK